MISAFKNFTCFLGIFFFTVLPLSAQEHLQPLDTYFPSMDDALKETIQKGEFLFNDSSRNSELLYVPENTLLDNAVTIKDPSHNLNIESLHFIPYPEGAGEQERASILLTSFNTLRSISTQEGITYISQRRGNESHLLIKESYHINNLDDKDTIEDPTVSSIPDYQKDFVYQKDTSFGGNYFSYEFVTSKEEIYLKVINLTAFRVFGLFKAIDDHELIMNISVIPVENGIITYTAAQALQQDTTEISILGFSIDLIASIQNRMKAVHQWFETRILEELD